VVGSPRAANGANAAADEMEFATARRALGGWQGRLWRAAATAFVLWHLWIVLIDPVDPTVARAVHVFLGAALGFALFAPRAIAGAPGATVPWYDGLLILPCLLIPAHYVLDADGIELRSFAGPNTADLLAAGFGIVLVLEFARRTAGPVMPLIAAAFIAYCFAGPFLPGILFHRGIALDQALVELFGNNGLLGTIVQVSASYIIMFVVFATFLQSSGAGEYFNDFALALVGRLRGGPAKVTVVSGILFGTISGSSVANVVASGSFTIPMMRRVGYDRATAAAVEATSSTGGQLTPPVMGAGAFIMAEVLGVAYAEIALAGVIPALLFYVANYVHCDLHARKAGLRGVPREELPRWAHLARHAYMAAPLLLLVWMLVAGFSPFRAAAWGIAATLAIMAGTALAHRLGVRGEGPVAALGGAVLETARAVYATLHGSLREVLQLIAVCASAGIVAGAIGVTGVGGRFANILLELAGASAFLAMLFAMVVAIILGMGVPTTAAYAIAAAVVAPGLTRLGVAPLVAHMFIFYFAVLSAITPPVALASFAAASMAGAEMWRTSVIAVKFALATFIVPFMFWISPALLGQGTLVGVAQAFCTAGIGVWLLACATEGWMWNGRLALPLRVLAAGGGLCLMVPEAYTDLFGLAVAAGLLLWQRGRFPGEGRRDA
jgi:TRAP transporter 4TM/12TM fusion protein